MNDIDELKDIIKMLGDSATIDSIVNEYGKRHCMIIFPQHKRIIEEILSKHTLLFRKNSANHAWELFEKKSAKALYVSDNRHFRTIRDAMVQIFNKNVPSSQGYFNIDDNHSAWFPQPHNDNWENKLSDDRLYWYETPKTTSVDYEPDNKLRYTFLHEENGYRFTGVFKFTGYIEGKTRMYKLVDDKVFFVVPRAPVVVCRVAYMKNYDGISPSDIPVNGGSYVTKNNDAYEKNNFHKYDDGYCYGYVETKHKHGHTADSKFAKAIALEQINRAYKKEDHIDGVTVVLVAFSPILKKNVVIGWYDNATIYRNRIEINGLIYMMKCLCKDAHLIPEDQRKFEVPRASGNIFGIGQSNYWYIQKYENAREFENALMNYIHSFH